MKKDPKNILVIGGGKGGTGKTLIAVNIAAYLSKLGSKVCVADLDPAGANAHTCFGIEPPKKTISDLLENRVDGISEIAADTGLANVKLVSWNTVPAGYKAFRGQERIRLLRDLKNTEFEYVVVDTGSGTGDDVLDFFHLSNEHILVVLPEPTSIEKTYRFLRALLLYKLKRLRLGAEAQAFLNSLIEDQLEAGRIAPAEIIGALAERDASCGRRIRKRLESMKPKLVLNQVRSYEDIEIGFAVRSACLKFFGLALDFIGYINYDEAVVKSVRDRKPLISLFPDATSARCIENVTNKLLAKEQLTFDFF